MARKIFSKSVLAHEEVARTPPGLRTRIDSDSVWGALVLKYCQAHENFIINEQYVRGCVRDNYI